MISQNFISDKLIDCKYLRDLNNNHKVGNIVDGQLRFTSNKGGTESFECGIHVELPKIIGDLHLNLSFLTRDQVLKRRNSTSPTKMIANDDVDYLTSDISMTGLLSDLNSIASSNYINEDYLTNFLMKKQSIRISLENYYSIFNILIWILLFATIVVVGVIQGMKLILRKEDNRKNIFKFTSDLIFNYFNLMMSNQSSILLHKIVPRNYIMYFIPLLSIIVVNLMKESIYSNMISPPKQWCETLECFAQSNIRFVTLDRWLYNNLLKIRKEHEFKLIASRTTWSRANSKFKK